MWIGPGRGEETLTKWIATLTPEQKSEVTLFSMDMYQPFLAAIQCDPAFAHVVVVHDTFHLVKRANEAIAEMRRETFFRAGPAMRRPQGAD